MLQGAVVGRPGFLDCRSGRPLSHAASARAALAIPIHSISVVPWANLRA